jgi:hypothetical protein
MNRDRTETKSLELLSDAGGFTPLQGMDLITLPSRLGGKTASTLYDAGLVGGLLAESHRSDLTPRTV